MTGLIGSSNAISTGFAWIFIHLFDNIAYMLLATSYAIFRAVSKLDIFGTESVNKLFTGITNRVYNVIFIVAVFIVSYQVLMYIVNPDKNKDKLNNGTGRLVWNIMLSVILVIMCPLLFRYMAIFQEHVLSEGTVFSLVSGTGAAPDTKWQGKGFALVMYMSMLHPAGTDYSTFFDTSKADIELKTADVAKPACKSQCQDEGYDETPCQNVCADYYSNLEKIMGSLDNSKSVVWTLSDGMSHLIDDGVAEYSWVIATVVGLVVAWFFISYALDLGVRAVKLGFLQLIAPVPILMKPFTKPGGSFDKWFKELTKTYLELFVRLATIALSIEIIKAIPALFDALLKADDNITTMSKPIAFVILVLGVLKFAKEAPDLLKNIFSGGGNWLSGLDLKPGVKRRVENNTYAMKGLSAGAGMLSGAGAGLLKGYHDSKEAGGTTKTNALHAASGLLRGARTGMVSGFKNSSTTLKGMGDVADTSRASAHIAQQKHQEQVANHKSLIQQAYSDANIGPNANIVDKFNAIVAGQGKHIVQTFDNLEEDGKNLYRTYSGQNGVVDISRVENLNLAAESAKGLGAEVDNQIASTVNSIKEQKKKLDEARFEGKTKVGDWEYRTYTEGNETKQGWFNTTVTAGTDKKGSWEYLAAKRKREATENAEGFKTQRAEYAAELEKQFAKMESYLKKSNLKAGDWEHIAKKMGDAMGQTFNPKDLQQDFAKTLMSRVKDSSGNIVDLGAGLMAMQQASKTLDSMSKGTSALNQIQQSNKKDDKKS